MSVTGTTGTISSAGIGSGLDVNSIVTKLMATEQQPLTNLQTAAATMQTQLSAFGQMQSAISALHDAAAPLFSADTFAQTTTGSSDPGSAVASATTKAVPGTYSISVSALSAGQSIVSATGNQFTGSTSPVGTGTLTIRLAKAGSTPVTIAIGTADNTLAGVRDKINAANAGVTATLVTDASGTRIALQSSASGLDNAFSVTVAEDAGTPGLARLAYDPKSVSPMLLAQSAANTVATVNGIAVSSSNNTLASVVDGMSFSLSKVTTAPVTISVTRNTASIKSQLSTFVAAYNQLNQFLADATKYDASTKRAALLQGDSTTVGIQNQLHALLGQTSGASSTFRTLSSLGVQVQKDGSLKLDDATATAALANLPELTRALSNVDATNSANNGFAKKFAVWTDNLLASNGTLPGKTKSIQSRIASNQKDQDAMNTRLAQIQRLLLAQYSALDSKMASANALSAYVTQQIATWNKNPA